MEFSANSWTDLGQKAAYANKGRWDGKNEVGHKTRVEDLGPVFS